MITTDIFSISRTELARIMSEEFVRKYWWFAAPVPVCGILFIIFSTGPLQALGMLMLLWPFSIPARSVLFSTKASRLFTGGCHVEATEDAVVFISEYNKQGKRLRYPIDTSRILEVVPRNGCLLVRMRTPGIAPIKDDAFKSAEDRTKFIEMIATAITKRLEDPPAAESMEPPT